MLDFSISTVSNSDGLVHTFPLFLRPGQALQTSEATEYSAIFCSPKWVLLQRKHISPLQKDSPGVSKGSLTAAPLQTASACPGCTAGRLGAFPGKRPVPCKAFRPRASALRPCHPATKQTTQLFRVLCFNSSIYIFFFP